MRGKHLSYFCHWGKLEYKHIEAQISPFFPQVLGPWKAGENLMHNVQNIPPALKHSTRNQESMLGNHAGFPIEETQYFSRAHLFRTVVYFILFSHNLYFIF